MTQDANSETPRKTVKPRKAATRAAPGEVILLSGGNPQIPKGDGDEPVQAYIAAMPGWKSPIGKRIDALVEEAVPGVAKAVKWNSPFYGRPGEGWFLSLHCFTKYIKVTFFSGGIAAAHPRWKIEVSAGALPGHPRR